MSAAAAERWLPGDRLPDARLRDAEGAGLSLHAECAGAPLWLATPADPAAAAALPPPPAGMLALCLGTSALTAAPGWRAYTADPRWLAALGAGVLWLADANLRLQVARALPAGEPPLPGDPAPALLPAQTLAAAPVLQIPDVFERDFCAELIRHLDQDCGGGDASGVLVLENGEQRFELDPSVKLRRESFPRDAALDARMHERLLRRALPEIARVFQFQVARRDPFKLLAYPEGAGYFHAHRDNETPDVAYRRFALSVNLNSGAYEGGEFRYPEFGPHLYSPPVGSALVFSCSLLHEVRPVRRGTRYAMTTFLS
ncbi:2OG-Fe(II) oxygenase family protein [Lysobacter silvisoli]|uniref:2OG-Fe(II) oxygenase n=1 Tax=Lysobacter silvisoli TaxID=2293254 RepID=A0A371JZN5_9GAMM|nr:2OG-Fe(II) oxygenase [Lysobacter silvisoli]RDZ27128.1 2OG-Fe(II) oxygenase [Lysobacter silvisoli]